VGGGDPLGSEQGRVDRAEDFLAGLVEPAEPLPQFLEDLGFDPVDHARAVRALADRDGQVPEVVDARLDALVDVLQPCVTFNRKNTYDWYRERVYSLAETDYDPGDRVAAFQKALEWGDRIPLGVIYRTELPSYEEQVAGLAEGPVAGRKLEKLTADQVASLRGEFM
jgi:hypothetical protein